MAYPDLDSLTNPLAADPETNVRFVAPGAPRSVTFGARYRF